MSDNGSIVSIEEIGVEDIEQITLECTKDGDIEVKEDEDPPLDLLEPVKANEGTTDTPAADVEPINFEKETINLEQPDLVETIEEVPRAPQADPPQSVRVVSRPIEDDGEEDDEEIDETLTERLIGLSEMFPDSLRSGTISLVKNSWSGTQYLYGFSRSAAWIIFSTASILFMPVMIETERLSIMDQQKQQKTQMLLGPGVASSGAPSLGPPPI